jgi:DNA-binding CsgD family transcriptional regulator
MTERVTVSERDLRTLVGIVSDDRSDLPADGLPLSLLTELAGQIRCELLSFFGLDSSQQELWFGQVLPDEGDADDQAFWVHYRDCADCSYPDRSGDLRAVTKLSDFYSARQWHGTGMYSDYGRMLGLEHELRLCLPAGLGPAGGLGRSVRLMLIRGRGPDFSPRDRALLALLRPHLHQAYRDAERRRRGIPALTPRQWELLNLVAAGHSNTQIARRLGLSPGTVRKHLENIYGRLQVSSRTAALARAFPDRTAP